MWPLPDPDPLQLKQGEGIDDARRVRAVVDGDEDSPVRRKGKLPWRISQVKPYPAHPLPSYDIDHLNGILSRCRHIGPLTSFVKGNPLWAPARCDRIEDLHCPLVEDRNDICIGVGYIALEVGEFPARDGNMEDRGETDTIEYRL